jgi:hypothetical protein
MLKDILLKSSCKSHWETWLVNSDTIAAIETLAFLERAYARLLPQKRSSITKRILNGDSTEVSSVIHELLIFEVCSLLEITTDFGPQVSGKHPDFKLRRGNETFLADAFIINRPDSTYRKFNGFQGYCDKGESAKKIAEAICKKVDRYKILKIPLLVFIIPSGHEVNPSIEKKSGHDLHLCNLEKALYGATIEEIDGISLPYQEGWPYGGIFCPPGSSAQLQELSAVIWCDWFDTPNRKHPGRRLSCVVYHHWQPLHALPDYFFGQFPQIRWHQVGKMLMPSVNGVGNLVLETSSLAEIHFAPYSPNEAW